MTLDQAGYRTWSEALRPSWFACWAIARSGLTLILRRKVFWVLLGLALLQFLFVFAVIYLAAQLGAANPQIRRFAGRAIDSHLGEADMYRNFMYAQGTVTMLILAFAGEMLVGGDYRRGGLTFYLSRRIGRVHYWFGKLLTVGLLVMLTTTIPALVLYAEYGLMTDGWEYFRESFDILLGIFGYGMLLAVTLSLLLFALASWIQRTVPLVVAWACVFLFIPALATLLRGVFNDRHWLLLVLWRDLRVVGSWCFGIVDERDVEILGWAALAVAAVCIISAAVAIPRLRAVQVVR